MVRSTGTEAFEQWQRESQAGRRIIAGQSIRVDYPDEDVKVRVARFLSSRHFSTLMEIEVEVLHGQVTLTGEVDSFYEKQVAMNSCQRVAGVLSLVDHISVKKPK